MYSDDNFRKKKKKKKMMTSKTALFGRSQCSWPGGRASTMTVYYQVFLSGIRLVDPCSLRSHEQ